MDEFTPYSNCSMRQNVEQFKMIKNPKALA